MTALLQKVLERAASLPASFQEQMAEEWLEEIEWELKWDQTLAESHAILEKMAHEGVQEFEAGKTHLKGFDER
ncbi:MAG: hypothetical protein HQK55_08720 [Deltaproteobacteria bacterium]|nr:hypothetical protein [Deltaproteobacteria bacterium]